MITYTPVNRANLFNIALLASIVPMLWLCSIPLGNTLRSILFVGCIACIFFQKQALFQIKVQLESTWFIFLSLAIGWSMISISWAPAFEHQTKFYLNKLLFLMIFPIIVPVFSTIKKSKLVLDGFLISMLIPFSLALIKYYTHWQWHGDDDPGHLFYNHIITGLYSTFAAFVALEMFFNYRKAIYLLAWALFSFQVLGINTGKMSYLLYLVILGFSLWPRCKNSYRLGFVIVLPCLILMIYQLSHTLQHGVEHLLQDWQQFQKGQADTSLGFRIQFHRFAYLQFSKHWLIGGGLGSYDHWFKVLNPVPAWTYEPNTHSQFWFFLSDTGCVGLMLWLGFFMSLTLQARKLGWYGHIFMGFLIIFTINCFSDNLLFASPTSLLIGLWGLINQAHENNKHSSEKV